MILRDTTTDPRGRVISSWALRKDAILPVLTSELSNDNKAEREETALALFALGQRNPVIIALIGQAASDPDRPYKKFEFESALEQWQGEQGMEEGVDPAAEGDGVPLGSRPDEADRRNFRRLAHLAAAFPKIVPTTPPRIAMRAGHARAFSTSVDRPFTRMAKPLIDVARMNVPAKR